jgi:hypothetical protein
MNEPETHDILVKQVQFIEIVRPAPKPGSGEIIPTPPTLTTLTTLTPETIGQTGQPNGPGGPAVTPAVGCPAPATTNVTPATTNVAPEVSKTEDDIGTLRIEVNRPKEVK